MENILLAISWYLPMHDCSIADIPIFNQLNVSFSTAALHFQMLTNYITQDYKDRIYEECA